MHGFYWSYLNIYNNKDFDKKLLKPFLDLIEKQDCQLPYNVKPIKSQWIEMNWDLSPMTITVLVNLTNNQAQFIYNDNSDGDYLGKDIDLNTDEGWKFLIDFINETYKDCLKRLENIYNKNR